MSCLQTIRVFNGRENTAAQVFGLVAADGTASLFDFSTATRFTLTFTVDGVVRVIDTAVLAEATTMVEGPGAGEITFDLGDEAIPAGVYIADLVFYSPTYPTGYMLDAEDGHTLQLDVR
jgi:hypothetical protein